jgi:small ligand-binding sensory domain FIST
MVMGAMLGGAVGGLYAGLSIGIIAGPWGALAGAVNGLVGGAICGSLQGRAMAQGSSLRTILDSLQEINKRLAEMSENIGKACDKFDESKAEADYLRENFIRVGDKGEDGDSLAMLRDCVEKCQASLDEINVLTRRIEGETIRIRARQKC